MILENKTETVVLEEGEIQESTKMEIDKDSHVFLMRMLSKFYSDGIGSLIRETCSNALDSHRERDVNEPIIVSFKIVKDNYEFSVQDLVVGWMIKTLLILLVNTGSPLNGIVILSLGHLA